ncbi:hypothetical protein BDV95DRAFT_609687 [Massariosphaeria phaeospora]|uniref:Uncharacterized protein n=1 Tax=Massariosphaeria phaeospora TaxID=100035 RepID=A0A7C8MB94_9PLEO|nr:hypothetical protein BDV95DRAFT_609687 [Massariosphaeria phaeospora]
MGKKLDNVEGILGAYGPNFQGNSFNAQTANIRTGEIMQKVHHCNDNDCNGKAATKACYLKLHRAFCLAPIVDDGKDSPTFNQVVICGRSFNVKSPGGCGQHAYGEDHNFDIRAAKNAWPMPKVTWQQRFNDFKAEHDSMMALRVEKQELADRKATMTANQRNKYEQTDKMEQENKRGPIGCFQGSTSVKWQDRKDLSTMTAPKEAPDAPMMKRKDAKAYKKQQRTIFRMDQARAEAEMRRDQEEKAKEAAELAPRKEAKKGKTAGGNRFLSRFGKR